MKRTKSGSPVPMVVVVALTILAQGCAHRTSTGISDHDGLDDPQRTLTLDLGQGVEMELIRLPAGDDDATRLYVGRHEVTQPQWRAVMGSNPSWYPGESLPVNKVSWFDCQAFCKALADRSGYEVRLPSLEEWEVACLAGSTRAYCFGDSVDELGAYAWYEDNSPRKPNSVGQKLPNAWGLYDVHGNVWEWTQDTHTVTESGEQPTPNARPTHRVLKGGAWFGDAQACRVDARIIRPAAMRSGYIGLRVVVELH